MYANGSQIEGVGGGGVGCGRRGSGEWGVGTGGEGGLEALVFIVMG